MLGPMRKPATAVPARITGRLTETSAITPLRHCAEAADNYTDNPAVRTIFAAGCQGANPSAVA